MAVNTDPSFSRATESDRTLGRSSTDLDITWPQVAGSIGHPYHPVSLYSALTFCFSSPISPPHRSSSTHPGCGHLVSQWLSCPVLSSHPGHGVPLEPVTFFPPAQAHQLQFFKCLLLYFLSNNSTCHATPRKPLCIQQGDRNISKN